MPKFVEFEYHEEKLPIYINAEYVTNVQPWGEDATMVCLMPHLEVFVDNTQPPHLPFVAIVAGNISEVMHKLNDA